MNALGLAAALALAPGLFWLWFFVRKNDYRPEPRRLLAATFVWGMLAVLPAALIETPLLGDLLDNPDLPLRIAAAQFLFVVGPVEEGCKFLAVRLHAYRSRYFEEPMDGLVYAAAASLGFASAENFFYVLTFGPEVMIARAPLSTLAHLVFGCIWGYALGAGIRRTGGAAFALAGLAVAAGLHGAFNAAVFGPYPLAGIGLVVLGAFWTMSRFNWARRISPFRLRRNYPFVTCRQCQALVRVTRASCLRCGSPAARGHGPLICGNCKAVNRPAAAFCVQCGDRFEG